MTIAPFKLPLLSTLLILAAAGAVPAASFDCAKADLAADEKVICDDRALNDADVKMVTTFELLSGLLAMGSRGTLQDDQVEWLSRRQACGGDAACIRTAYDERMTALDEVYKSLQRPM